MKGVAIVCFLLVWNLSGFSQEGETWQELYDQALDAYAAGNLDQAINIAQQAISKAEKDYGIASQPFAYTAQLLSVSCYETAQFGLGIAYAQKEIESNRLRQAHDTLYAKSVQNLVLNLQADGQMDAAIPLIRELIAIHRESRGTGSLEFNVALSDLAHGLLSQGKNDTALVLLKQANVELQKNADGGHDFINNLYQIAVLEYQLGFGDKALVDLASLRRILEENGLENELIYGQAMDQLGAIYYARENLDQAAGYYQSAIEVYSQLYPNPASYKPTLVDLAAIFLKIGEKNKSDSLLALLPGDHLDSNIMVNQINLATSKYQDGLLTEALSLYRQILGSPGFDQLTDQNLKADVLVNYASLNLESGQYREAIRASDHIIPYYRQSLNQRKLGIALNIRARAHGHLAHFDSAQADHRKAFELLAELDMKTQTVVVSDFMEYYHELGQFDHAHEIYEQATGQVPGLTSRLGNTYALILFSEGNLLAARDLLLSLPNPELSTKMTLAVVSLELDDFARAEECLQEIMKALAQSGERHSLQYAETLINLGRLNLNQGNYAVAESFYLEGLSILDNDQMPQVSRANGLNAVAIFYQTMGNYDRALEYYIQAQAVYHDNSTELADLLQNMATLLQINNEEDESIKLLNEAIEIYRSAYGEKHPYYAVALQNLASAYETKGSMEEAEALYRQALEINLAVYGENHNSSATIMHNLAVLYEEIDQYQKSLGLFKKVITIRKDLLGEHHPDYTYSVYGLAVLYYRMRALPEAKPYFDLVIGEYLYQIENYFQFLSEKEKSAFYRKIKEVFEAYYDFALEYSEVEPAILAQLFELHMATKAILLTSSNAVRRSVLDSGDPALIADFQRWIGIKEEIIRAYGSTKSQLANTGADIRQLEESANQIEKQLSIRSTDFGKGRNARVVTWGEVKDQLSSEEAVVEMLRIRKNLKNDSIVYVAFIITPETEGYPKIVTLPNGNAMEGKWFRGYINTMRFQIKHSFGFDRFWAPIAAELPQAKTIYFSPDGIYNKININTLQNPVDSKYVLDIVQIRYLTKASQLVDPRIPSKNQRLARLFGYPDFDYNSSLRGVTSFNRIVDLPGTRAELEQLGQLLGENNWNSETFLEEKATEANIKVDNNARILHIATHGFFLEDVTSAPHDQYPLQENPLLRCGLLLAGSQDSFKGNRIIFNAQSDEEDGVLTAYEVMNLDLRGTEVVVLSACETALGEVENGEGVYGLQRAFIASGAQSTVMSLWKVDDFATQELMVNFYQHFLSGDDKFLAFNKAQKMMRSRYDAPYFWGAFIINGR